MLKKQVAYILNANNKRPGGNNIMTKPDQNETNKSIDNEIFEYQWCLHCERTYKNGEHRLVDGLMMCPYEDCDGDVFMDSWSWSSIQEKHQDYPKIPKKGKVYPLYS